MPFNGCEGKSPSGVQWWLTFPQHTGSQTIVDYVFYRMGVETCRHSHSIRDLWCNDLVQPYHGVFVRSPYQRLISAAAHASIIDMEAFVTARANSSATVASFRMWLSKDAENNFPSMNVISDMLNRSCRAPDFGGHTTSLKYDLHKFLTNVGYSIVYKNMSLHSHCLSGCTADERNARRHLRWFGADDERRVQKWFADDFLRFNFSTRASDTWSHLSSDVRF